MGLCVTGGASMTCSFGMAPSVLNVLPAAVCEYYAVWHVPEHGKSGCGGGNCRGNGSADPHALYARAGGSLGAGRSPGISRG